MSYGYRRGRAPKQETAKLTKIARLTLTDLMKVRKALDAYPARKRENEAANNTISQDNEQIDIRNKQKLARHEALTKRFNDTYIAPVDRQIDELRISLKLYKLSWLQRQFTEYIEYHFEHYNKLAQPILDSIDQLIVKRSALYEDCTKKFGDYRDLVLEKKTNLKRPIADYVNLVLGGIQTKVEFTSINRDELDKLILSHLAESERKNDSLKEIKARASANELETRVQARQYRRDIEKQKSTCDCCPYCSGKLVADDAHLDHIYPVSKGGQSVPRNLVFVCSACNLRKKNMTLRNFIEITGLDATGVHSRLDILKKDF